MSSARIGPHGCESTLACIKIPRSSTNEVGEYEMIVTSELHAQAERAKTQKREEKAASSGGGDAEKDAVPEGGS